MDYTELLSRDSIILNVEASDGDQVLRALAAKLVEQDSGLAGREEEIFQTLHEREQQGSTGSAGVAIPHIKVDGVERVTIAVAVHQEGLDFRALDGEDIHVFFGVIRPEASADQHLDILRWIAGVAAHQDFVAFARQATSPEQIVDLLTELSAA